MTSSGSLDIFPNATNQEAAFLNADKGNGLRPSRRRAPEQDFLTRWYEDRWHPILPKYNWQLHQLLYIIMAESTYWALHWP